MAIIFDGKTLAASLEKGLTRKVKDLSERLGRPPCLSTVQIGNLAANLLYLRLKEKASRRIGVAFKRFDFASSASRKEIEKCIIALNRNPSIDGIMVQIPIGGDFTAEEKLGIVNSIAPKKDVDGLTAENLGLLQLGKPRFLPATVKAIELILEKAGQKDIKGKNISILGKSNIVGKPLLNLLVNKGATVTICSKSTKSLSCFMSKGDIIISATGTKNIVKGEMIKKEAVVIDVGEPLPDVELTSVAKKASFVTPVPGGVGPLTVVCLLENLVEAASADS